MNGETLLNTYTILVVATIALLIWAGITFMKKPKGAAKLLSQSQENLTGLGAFMMALCSIGLSIGFSLSLATSIFIGVLFVSLFTGFCIAEFTASFHLAKAWADGRLGRVGAAVFLLVGGAAISIIAGQALIAAKVDEAQAKRMQASEVYQQALKTRKQADEQVKQLAVDGSIVTQAQEKLARFESDLATLKSQQEQVVQRRNACPPNHLTKCINPANTEITTIDSKIAITQGAIDKEQTILLQFDRYQNAKSYAETLQKQPLPPTVVSDSVLPGIKALAIVLGMSTEVVSAHVFLFLAVFGELGGIILFYLWGASRLERALVYESGSRIFEGDFTRSETPAHPFEAETPANLAIELDHLRKSKIQMESMLAQLTEKLEAIEKSPKS
jgi:uncharacterized protein (DUF1330 family)